MKKALLLFTILFCCIFNAVAQEKIEPEEYEVYKAWLEKSFITSDTKQIFITKFTIYRDLNSAIDSRENRQLLLRLQSSTLEDFRLHNRKSLELKNDFGVSPIVNLIIEDDLGNYLGNGSPYPDFAKKFGAEYRISFSRVGFNKKKNQALIQVDYRSNTIRKYQFGYYFLLSKEKDSWIIKKRTKSWEY